jgi:hypothetical protein
MKGEKRYVHLKKDDNEQVTMIRLKKIKADELVNKDSSWIYTSREEWRKWKIDNRIEISKLPQHIPSIKKTIDDREYRKPKPIVETYKRGKRKEEDFTTIPIVKLNWQEKQEHKELLRKLQLVSLTQIPFEKVQTQRNRYNKSSNEHIGRNIYYQEIVAKESITLYKECLNDLSIRLKLTIKEVKILVKADGIKFNGVKYITIPVRQYTKEEIEYIKLQLNYSTKDFIIDVKNDDKDTQICVKRSNGIIIHKAKDKTSIKTKNWKHPIKPKSLKR